MHTHIKCLFPVNHVPTGSYYVQNALKMSSVRSLYDIRRIKSWIQSSHGQNVPTTVHQPVMTMMRGTFPEALIRHLCRDWQHWDIYCDSASAFDDNLIDGRRNSLDWFISSFHLVHFHFSQSFLSKCSRHTKKGRIVQVAPAAIVCTGYDTVSHFGSQINKMASFQVVAVHYIPLWPQAAGK